MTAERWQQITELFEAALEREPSDRSGFLDRACNGDKELRAEVESLLAQHEQADSFIERPVLDPSVSPANTVSESSMSLASDHNLNGQTLGHYQIVELLGTGGMGVVYKARDTRLDRLVAIKVLPSDQVADPERRRRFVQEAKAASALNHPHIITIYDIGQSNGLDFIAMEYVPGKPLDQLIPRKGLRLNEALRYAVQIADALSAAHAVSIVHRDLKPGNIMVSQSDLVKVLDFGLAKLIHKTKITDGEETQTLQATVPSLTEEGVILGTVAYMSPEQAEGKRVDARSDIFSFGSMLYEMLTGQKAFQGNSKLSIMTAILRGEPTPANQIVKGLPQELDRILVRCLRKDPSRRFQTMADLKVALEELKEESDSRPPVTTPQLLRRRWKLVSIIALLLLLTVGVLVWFTHSPMREQEPQLTSIPLTSYPGEELYPSFSPDGNQVAFSWSGAKQDNYDIYIKLIGPGEPLRLTTDPAEDYSPAWSPDGRFIAFLRYRSTGRVALMLVPALGGAERQVAEFSGFPQFLLRDAVSRDLTWSPDGKWLALPDDPPAGEGLYLLSVETGEKQRLTSSPAQSHDMNPAFAPDGHALAFVRSGSYALLGDIYVLPLSESLTPQGEPKRLTFEGMNCTPAWTADGREIVFVSGQVIARRSLWKIVASGSGKPQRLTSVGEYGLLPAISRQGRRLAYVRWLTDYNIGRVEIGGRDGTSSPASSFISSTLTEGAPQYSSDGKKIAFQSDRSGSAEIWVCNSDGSSPQQVTFFGGPQTGNPRWSPDGKQIVFDSERDGRPTDIYIISSDGGKPHRLIGDAINLCPSWSRNGKWIYFLSDRSGQLQVWKLPTSGGQGVQVTRKGGYIAFESPDGKFVYYAKDPEVPTSLWKVPVDGGEETRVLDSIGHGTNFAVVDEGIYFLSGDITYKTPGVPVQFFSFATGQIKTVSTSTIEKNLWGGLSVSPDGRGVLFTYIEQQGSDLVLVENFH